MKPRLRVRFIFAWYDFWVGLYYDRYQRVLYFCPVPMLCLRFQWQSERDRRIEVLYD